MTVGPALLLAAKLALVLGVVLAASLVARRFGHAAGGLLAGMPVIAGPITGLLLIDLPALDVRAVCLATLACQPALIAYLLCFAHAAQRWRWPASLGAALALFFACSAVLLQLPLPEWGRIALAVAAPVLGLRAMPTAARGGHGGPVTLPRIELAWRAGVALVVAAGVLWGAQHLSTGLAGLLLAAPIAGTVLPAFTSQRHGGAATAGLLAGFVRGQVGFVSFFVVMLFVLARWPAAVAWATAMLASALLPWLVAQRRARVLPRR